MPIYALDPRKTALLVIDAQNEYFRSDGALYTPNAAAIGPALTDLRKAAHDAGVMTVLVKHVHRNSGADVGRMGDFDETVCFVEGTEGADFADFIAPSEKDVVVTKRRYSSFVGTELDGLLRGNGIDTIIVSGLMTQFCCVTTARHAHDLDYRVVFVSDANAGPDMPDVGQGAVPHEETLRVILTALSMGVAEVRTTADLVKEMLSTS